MEMRLFLWCINIQGETLQQDGLEEHKERLQLICELHTSMIHEPVTKAEKAGRKTARCINNWGNLLTNHWGSIAIGSSKSDSSPYLV